MATTFQVFYLGQLADVDTIEGNGDSESASALVGLTLGSATDPIYDEIHTFSPGSTGYSAGYPDYYDQGGNDTFRIDGGSDHTFDSITAYNATITYVDGTTAVISALIVQDKTGNTYLVPESSYNTDQIALEAQPIQSIRLDSINQSTGIAGLGANRYDATFAEPDPVDGTAGNDTIGAGYTDAQGDQIDGTDGWADVVYGYDGADSIAGGEASDTLVGGTGADTLLGEAGDDSLMGDADNDSIDGGAGADTLEGGAGDDTVLGGAGNDYLDDEIGAGNGAGADWFDGGADNDMMWSGVGDDTLIGGTGNDLLVGEEDADTFLYFDGFGNDTIWGAETTSVGTDDDVVDLSNLSGGVTVTYSGAEAGTFTDGSGTGTFYEIEHVVLTEQADSLNGASDTVGLDIDGLGGNDTLIGGAGGDTLTGGAGDDSLIGNSGNDYFLGGLGNDYMDGGTLWWDVVDYYLETTSIVIDLSAGTAIGASIGTDTLIGIEEVRGSSVADTLIGSTAGEFLKAGGGDDVLIAGASSGDSLFGDTGADTLTGGTGDDWLGGGSDNDLFLLASSFGTDTIIGGTGIDTIDLSSASGPVTVHHTGNAAGWITDGTDTLTFSEIERFILTDFNDSMTSGGDSLGFEVWTGAGNDTVWAGSGADTIHGEDGIDELYGDSGDDLIDGGDGNDDLGGDDGNDTILGGAGDDYVQGMVGDDVLYGGTGDDEILGQSGSDTIVMEDGFGADTISGGSLGTDSDLIDFDLLTGPVTVTYSGGEAGTFTNGTHTASFTDIERFTLTDFNDSINGNADTVGATVDAGTGNDYIDYWFASGSYDLIGGTGNDSLFTGSGADTVDGGDGNDIIWTNTGADSVVAGAGDDSVQTDTGADTVLGGDGNDTIWSGLDNDLVSGGEGADWVYGGYGNDTIQGDAGDDTLTGGRNDDTVDGGDGADLIYFETTMGNDVVIGGEGGTDLDTLDYSALSTGVTATFTTDEAGTVGDGTYTTTFSQIEALSLTNLADTADASLVAAAVYLDGLAGDDSLVGGSGDDTILGGTGDDTIAGGAGSDTLDGGDDADHFLVTDAAGTDAITGGEGGDDWDQLTLTNVTYADGVTVTFSGNEAGSYDFTSGTGTGTFTGIEQVTTTQNADYVDLTATTAGELVYTLGGNDTVLGGDGDETIYAGDGADSIESGAGDDTIYGEGGDDTIIAGAGSDFVDGGDGADLINTRMPVGQGLPDIGYPGLFTADADPSNNLDTVYGGTGNDTILTGDDADLVYGGDDDDWIEGGFDADTLSGDGGHDTIIAGEGSDVVSGGDGDDLLIGGYDTSDPYFFDTPDASDLVPGNDADTIDGGTGNDTIYGYDDADSLSGGDGTDQLFGGADDDTLAGNAGDDLLTGGEGDDVFVYTVGDGADTVADFNTGISGPINDGNSANNDFIDLSGYYDSLSQLYADQADDGVLNQSNATDTKGRAVDYSDNTQFGTGSLTFTGATADNTFFTAENTGLPCFTAGTMILTPSGEVPVERLRPGDLVVTRDNGPQPLLWSTMRKLGPADLDRAPALRPVLVKPGAFGQDRALIVSPQHGILVGNGPHEELVRAAQLALMRGGRVRAMAGCRRVSYVHLFFARHEVVFSNGLATESFYPGPRVLAGLEGGPLAELLAIFPDLGALVRGGGQTDVPSLYTPPARPYSRRKALPDHIAGLTRPR